MKRRHTLLLALLLLALTATSAPAQRTTSMEAFWQKFKTAVIAGDKRAVASMTEFPLGMSYGIPSVKNRASMLRRYRRNRRRRPGGPGRSGSPARTWAARKS
jgi:hypothetical protein